MSYTKDPFVHVGTAVGWVLWNPITGEVLGKGEFKEIEKGEGEDD